MFSGAMEREQQAVMGYKMSGWEMGNATVDSFHDRET